MLSCALRPGREAQRLKGEQVSAPLRRKVFPMAQNYDSWSRSALSTQTTCPVQTRVSAQCHASTATSLEVKTPDRSNCKALTWRHESFQSPRNRWHEGAGMHRGVYQSWWFHNRVACSIERRLVTAPVMLASTSHLVVSWHTRDSYRVRS